MSFRAEGRGRDRFDIVGTIVDGRYRIQRVTGEGGFGVVYRAEHLAFESPIALKVLKLPGQWTAERTRARVTAFQREGKVLFELSALHMSILRAFETGTIALSNGSAVPYLALEWLEGVSLADELRFRRAHELPPFTLEEALALLQGPATAIALAHQRGVVHRDIKPGNLFVTRGAGETTVKVLDFGIAQIIEDSWDASEEGAESPAATSSFTPAYAAPEQWLRHLGPTTCATDVHGLALVCSELLSGRAPFDGLEADELKAACLDGAARPTPRRCGVQLPAAVERVFERALALDPRERFQEVETFWAELCGAAAWDAGKSPSIAPLAANGMAALSSSAPLSTSAGRSATASTWDAPPQSRPAPRAQAWPPKLGMAVVLALVASSSVLGPGLVRPSQPASAPGSASAQVPRPAAVVTAGAPVVLTHPAPEESVTPASPSTTPKLAPATPALGPARLAGAEAALRRGNIAEACERAEAVFADAPTSADCAEFLGRCYMRLGQKSRSLEFYRSYLALAPHGRDAVFVRAIVESHEQ